MEKFKMVNPDNEIEYIEELNIEKEPMLIIRLFTY